MKRVKDISPKDQKFDSLVSLYERFPDEKSCRKHLEESRWDGKPACPRCNHDKIYRFKDGRLFKCANCKKQFTVTIGTIFEDTHISLRKWYLAIYLITAHKKGISSLQLSKDIRVTQKTAWFMLHRVRETFKPSGKKLCGTVEVDETYIGGKMKNKHENKKPLKSIINSVVTYKDKTPVFGLVQRNGEIISMPVNDTSKATLQAIITKKVRKGSKIISDEFTSYKGLNENYFHRFIIHSAGEHAIGVIHTNTIEGFWSLLKRGIIGIYHSVSPKHLHRYCSEFNYRYNTKEIADPNRFNKMLSNCQGRLTYKGLIN